MNKEKYPEEYKYLMTINIPTKEESANIVYANNIETLLVYIYKAIGKNPNQRQFHIELTNFEALYETTI